GAAYREAGAAVEDVGLHVHLAAVHDVAVAVRAARVAGDRADASRAARHAAGVAALVGARSTVGRGLEAGLAAVDTVTVAVLEARVADECVGALAGHALAAPVRHGRAVGRNGAAAGQLVHLAVAIVVDSVPAHFRAGRAPHRRAGRGGRRDGGRR